MVHACCLALLDACVPMSSVFTALTCGYTKDDKLITDPDAVQEKVPINAHPTIIVFSVLF